MNTKSPKRRTAARRAPNAADRTMSAGEEFARMNKIRDRVEFALRKIDSEIESIHKSRDIILRAWRSLDTKFLQEGGVITADDAKFIRRWRKARG